MKQLQVELGERAYPIVIGEGLLAQTGVWLRQLGVSAGQKLMVVTDEHVAPLYLEPLRQVLSSEGYDCVHTIIPAGEQAKSLAVYEQIMTEAIEAGLDRKSVMLALGGGVVGDVAGFAAATYMRGIPFVQLPTTLLAHDSSVGGKVAINHPLGKNLIGAFHQPLAVLYDTITLRSLPPREVAAGFAEVIKHGLIADASFVDWLEQQAEPLNALASEPLAEAIGRGCAIKAEVVAADEREQGQRAILNLGHTFGHAFEALCAYSRLNHGEAIAIGMCLAAATSVKLGLADSSVYRRTKSLLQRYGLPTTWPEGLNPHDVLTVMKRDKKGEKGQLVLVLPTRIGHVEIVRNVDASVVLHIMQEASEGER